MTSRRGRSLRRRRCRSRSTTATARRSPVRRVRSDDGPAIRLDWKGVRTSAVFSRRPTRAAAGFVGHHADWLVVHRRPLSQLDRQSAADGVHGADLPIERPRAEGAAAGRLAHDRSRCTSSRRSIICSKASAGRLGDQSRSDSDDRLHEGRTSSTKTAEHDGGLIMQHPAFQPSEGEGVRPEFRPTYLDEELLAQVRAAGERRMSAGGAEDHFAGRVPRSPRRGRRESTRAAGRPPSRR